MMVSLQMDRTRNIKVDLPEASQARHDFKPDMLNIAVDTNGAVWLEKKQVSLLELSTVVSNRFKVNTNLPVYVSADRLTKEGAIQDVLERVRNAGVQKVAFTVSASQNSETNAP